MSTMKLRLLLFGLLLTTGCATRHLGFFRVVPAEPTYLLRSPASEDIPFPQVLGRYTHLAHEWVDLKPAMGLRVENAYFREGAPRHGLAGFLGTEVARYLVEKTGRLRLTSVESKIPQRPNDQPPVHELLSVSSAHYPYHRFFYQIVLPSRGESRRAVLLGAGSAGELVRLGAQLVADPDSVCSDRSARCTVFPEACTVSVEMEVVVNGAPRTVPWDSSLADVANDSQRVELLRLYTGHLVPVEIDPSDPKALQLSLLPGDHVNLE